MAVYTKITKKDISSLVADYQIDKIDKLQGIKKGIETHNSSISSKKSLSS